MAKAKEYGRSLGLLENDVTVAVNTTQDMGSDKIKAHVHLNGNTRLYLYVKGNDASCSAALDFYFQVSPDGDNWHDLESLSVTLSGTDVVVGPETTIPLDLSDVNFFRLDRVKNNETEAGYTADINAWLSRKSGGGQ